MMTPDEFAAGPAGPQDRWSAVTEKLAEIERALEPVVSGVFEAESRPEAELLELWRVWLEGGSGSLFDLVSREPDGKDGEGPGSPGWVTKNGNTDFLRDRVDDDFRWIVTRELPPVGDAVVGPDHGANARRMQTGRPRGGLLPELVLPPHPKPESLLGRILWYLLFWRSIREQREWEGACRRLRRSYAEAYTPERPETLGEAFRLGCRALAELPEEQRVRHLEPTIDEEGEEVPAATTKLLDSLADTGLKAPGLAQQVRSTWSQVDASAFRAFRSPRRPRPKSILQAAGWVLRPGYRRRIIGKWESECRRVEFADAPERLPASEADWRKLYDARDWCRAEAETLDAARRRLSGRLATLESRGSKLIERLEQLRRDLTGFEEAEKARVLAKERLDRSRAIRRQIEGLLKSN